MRHMWVPDPRAGEDPNETIFYRCGRALCGRSVRRVGKGYIGTKTGISYTAEECGGFVPPKETYSLETELEKLILTLTKVASLATETKHPDVSDWANGMIGKANGILKQVR